MMKNLREFFVEYSEKIDKQSQQEYDKNFHNLLKGNAELASKTLDHCLTRYLAVSLIKDSPEQYPDKLTLINTLVQALKGNQQDKLIMMNAFNQSLKGNPVKGALDQNSFLDIFKSILIEDYCPPHDPDDICKQLIGLCMFYRLIAPYTPNLAHIIFLKSAHALAFLVGCAAFSSELFDQKGKDLDRTSESTKTLKMNCQERRKQVYAYYHKQKAEIGDRWLKHSKKRQAEFILKHLKEKGVLGLPGFSTIRSDLSEGKKAGLI